MIIVGLTGSIATGKSTAAKLLKKMGIMVFDSDAYVHKLMLKADIIAQIATKFPDAVENGIISRPKLGKEVFANKAGLKDLEKIIHPLVRKEIKRLIRKNAKNGAKIIVFDIPLLFEGGWEKYCDIVINVFCNHKTQEKRALERSNMNKDKFNSILSRLVDEKEREEKADFMLSSDYGLDYTKFELIRIINDLLEY